MAFNPILFADLNPEAQRCDPPEDRLIAGRPEAQAKTYFESGDERISIGTWSCEPGRWRVQYDETEYCRILEGSGAVISADGTVLPVKAGDEFVIPSGFSGEWLVETHLTKRFVVML